VRAWLAVGIVLAVGLVARTALADAQRIVLGTHDPALAAALSVAVSPRGLSVVELPETLTRVGDVPTARREIAVPGTVAVVWLCDDEAAAHALCFCGADGRLAVKALSVTPPLTPPDAAAVALSVKMMLGAPRPPAAPAPAAPPAPGPVPTVASVEPLQSLPVLTVELDVGARFQPAAAEHVGFRAGARGALGLEAFGRALGAGLAVAAGPALASDAPAGRSVSDWSLEAFALGRWLVRPAWLELSAGPQLHLLSVAAGPSAPRRADLALDALAGLVVPVGPLLLGARAGGFVVLTSPADTTTSVALPRWNGEAMVTFGFAVP
jgi:hypothetical protein